MLTENCITELFVTYLKVNNYSDIKSIASNQKGVDIKAINSDGKLFFVEVKGETSARQNSKRFGQYFTRNQIWNHVAVAFLKTMLDMSKPENGEVEFAIVLPFSHKELVKKLESSIRKIGIRVFFVSDKNTEEF